MDRVGVLIVSKCLSAPGIIDVFGRSGYKPEFYVVERQENPLTVSKAKVHQVVPDLNVAVVARFASRHKARLSFGLTDTEDFIVAGGRDAVERESGVPMLCVTERYAVEKSKADQRTLFERLFRDANPRYAIFDPTLYDSETRAAADFRRFASELKEPVIKPDAPARGEVEPRLASVTLSPGHLVTLSSAKARRARSYTSRSATPCARATRAQSSYSGVKTGGRPSRQPSLPWIGPHGVVTV